ncbi:Two component system sensor histidine kinase, PAS domain-containing [Desulfonema limicola]|uniref:histidine kinase n=1 Tax=Desulfonema limicola TaxID=45656 RepID=A0A975B811_9BACT|nr:PocR ligand-binding domain-containing protein [Desulfonema limicola]QTA80602.1 Two component system sensor histidine kinase, PAS domain-containing [Desulfonema limicola]
MINLREILNIKKLQTITDIFYSATGISSSIITIKGDVLTGSGWQDACTQFHRKNKETLEACQKSDTLIRDGLLREKSVIYKCPHGLIDAAAPIIVKGQHIANYFIGQFLFHKPDSEELIFFEKQAERYGFDKKAYLEAISRIPIIHEDRIDSILEYLSKFAELTAESGYTNLQNQQYAKELKNSHDRLEQLVLERTQLLREKNQELEKEIEQRKQAERILETERLKIFNLLNSLPAFICLQRPDYSISFVNEKFKNLFGSDLSLPCYKLIQNRDKPCKPCPSFEVFKTRSSIEWELNTGSKTYQVYDYPFYDLNNELLLLEMGIDITDRKNAENQLKESEEQYKKLINGSPDILYRFSKEKGGCYVSARVEDVLGYDAEYIIKNPLIWYNSIHPDDKDMVDKATLEFWEGKHFKIEYRIKDINGKWHWLYDRSIGRRTQGKDTIIEGLAMDITDRRMAEERFTTFFSMISDIFCIADINGYFRLINPAAQKILGYTEEELLSKPFMEFVYPDDIEKTQKIVNEQLAQGMTVINFKNRYICKDKSVKWLEWTSHPIKNQGITYAVARDCTRRMKSVKTLKAAMMELERSNTELEQFAYIASHDLQEPLRAIVGFLQLLQDRYNNRLDEKGHHYIDRTVKAAHRMQTLINDILTLSRVNTRGEPFVVEDLNSVMERTLEDLEPTVRNADAKISYTKMPCTAVDSSQIQSLLQNLIQNAIKYAGKKKPVIQISCREDETMYYFSVKDNGIGIDPKFHERIFLVFQRLHTRKEYQGTGLGLALCKKIVERHGGTIWVESESGKGAIFYFTLPKKMDIL